MYTAQPLPYYPTLSSPTTQPSNSIPSQQSSAASTADTSLLSDFTSDPDGGAGGKSWGHLDLSLGLGASLRRNGWTSNDGEHASQLRPEEVESPEDPYQPNGNWSTFADDLIVVDEDETEVEGETGRQEDETTNQPGTSSRRFPSSFRDSRFYGSHQTDLLVDVTPPFSSSTPPPPSHHRFPSSKFNQTGGEAVGSSHKNPGSRPSLQTLLNSIEDRTLQLHQESVSGISRVHRPSSYSSQYSDTTNQTPLINKVPPSKSEPSVSAPRVGSDAVQRLKEAMNRARSTRESPPTLNKQPSIKQAKPAQKRESRSRAAVENWLEETSAELSPSLQSNSQGDEPVEKPFQSPSFSQTRFLPTSPQVQTSKNLSSATPSGRRINAHPSFPLYSPRPSDHHPQSAEDVLREEDEIVEEISSNSSEQDSPPTPPPRLPPHFSRRSPSSFVVAPPSSPPSPPPRITLPPVSPSIKILHETRNSPQPRSEHLTPARPGTSLSVDTPIQDTTSVRDVQTPAAPGGWGRTPYQVKTNRTNKEHNRARSGFRLGELEAEQDAQTVSRQTEVIQETTKTSAPSTSKKTTTPSTSYSISQQTPLQNSFNASSSSKHTSLVSSRSPEAQLNVSSDRKTQSSTSASTPHVRLQSSLASSRSQLSPTHVETPLKKVQFEPKTPAAPGGWGWTPYQPKIRRDIIRVENKVKETGEAKNQVGQDLTGSNKGANERIEIRAGLETASEKKAISMRDSVTPNQEDANVEAAEVISDEPAGDEGGIMRETEHQYKDSLEMDGSADKEKFPAISEQKDEQEQHDLAEVHPDAESLALGVQFHSACLTPPKNQSSQDCSFSQGHSLSNVCPKAPATPLTAKILHHSSQTPISEPVSQKPNSKTPAAPGAWGWTPFPFKRRPSTLASQSPVTSSSFPQMSLPPSTPPKVSSSFDSPSQMITSASADQTNSPLPKRLTFSPSPTTTASATTSALSTMTTTASPSRLRIAHLRAQLDKAEKDEGAARRRIQNARKDWESVKWVRGKAADIGPREPIVVRAKVGLWTIFGWCVVVTWVCFSIARHVYDGYNDPLASSPFHPALYSPPESSSSLFTISMELPPELSAFEVPGQIQTRWNLLLRDWIATEWLKLK